MINYLSKKQIGLNIEYTCLNKSRIKYCHNKNVLVNTWKVNDNAISQALENYGIDFITSNNLGI